MITLSCIKKITKKKIKKNTLEREVKDRPIRLTYNEQKELDTIEDHITELEYVIANLDQQIKQAEDDYLQIQDLYNQRGVVEKDLNNKFDRWAHLTEIRNNSNRK